MATEFAQIIGSLAESLLGEPTARSDSELRYGARGSFSVDLTKGTWFDHEAGEGGGALDLVTRETKLTGQARLDWMQQHGFLFETVGHTNGGAPPRAKIIATYDYVDEGGEPLFQVVRFEPKDFRQRRRDERGGWTWSVKGIKRVPYRLPQVIENDERIICIVEGEKNVDRSWKEGVPATCNPGGAGKWHDELSEFFRGMDVVIIPDRDPQKKHPKTGAPMFHPDGTPILPGQDHAVAVAKSLTGVASRVRILELWKYWPEMPLKGDIFNWYDHGGTADKLYALIDSLPEFVQGAVATVPLLFPFPIDGETIPRRQWIVPGLLLRRNVTILVAPPGSGKSLLTLQLGLMMASGAPWGGWFPRGPVKTLIINAEDDNDEMRRRLFAAREEMKLVDADLRNRVAIAEAPGDIIIAKADTRTKTVIAQPMFERLVETVKEHKFDVLVVDPFAETFEGDENSNSELKWAAVLWRRIARETNAAVLLVHHTRKFNAAAGDMDSARGGGALVGVARIVSTLFQMTAEEAAIYEVKEEERHHYLRFDDAKANLTLVTFAARWFFKATVTLPNAGDDGEPADEIGVLIPWAPQGIFTRISSDLANAMLDTLTKGIEVKADKPNDPFCMTRKGGENKRWAGNVIMGSVECTRDEAQKVIDTWVESGLLVEYEIATTTSKGRLRKGLRVNDAHRPGTLISKEHV